MNRIVETALPDSASEVDTIGAEAARLLLEVLHDPDRHPRSLLLPLTMVIRSSTGLVPARRVNG